VTAIVLGIALLPQLLDEPLLDEPGPPELDAPELEVPPTPEPFCEPPPREHSLWQAVHSKAPPSTCVE
jgi:hypothetical protein